MATTARGLALVAIACLMTRLWERGERHRSLMLVLGLFDDWPMIVAACAECAAFATERFLSPKANVRDGRWPIDAAWLAALAIGAYWTWRDDPHQSQSLILAGLGGYALFVLGARIIINGWRFKRAPIWFELSLCWLVPVVAMIAVWIPESRRGEVGRALIERCRFTETPTDDIERLALWCREHTPSDARFVGPPGPKTFRLWSRRSLAFNRAASPYHAKGLADWGERFRDHVNFQGSLREFAFAYLDDRQGLEQRYNHLSDRQLADLARRQGASHVLVGADPQADSNKKPQAPPLELLRREGRYAVYRLR